jgi:outer membrane lipoprotein SlyB
VIESKTAQNSKDETILRVKLVSVTYNGNTYPVESTVQTASTERVRSATKGTDAKKVAGGAIIGAIAGQVIGKNTKGTVIGAAAGAAAGTAAAAATANYDTCLGDGGAISVVLDAPVTVKPVPVP